MGGVVVHAIFVDAVEKSGETIIIALLDGIEFVIMTSAAFERKGQKRGAESMDAVSDVFGAPFFFDAAAFVGLAMQAIESCGEALLVCSIGQQITLQVFGQETVVRQVVVKGLNDPIPIRPGRAKQIALITVAVGVARSVEPGNSHALPEMF